VISVITPVYNGDRFIASCIQAVIQQNCPQVEHLIIDGGSTDHTVAIIQQYAAQYPHIRWISERDRGQSDAMNKGIALAKGNIIALLNVDDYYEPDVLNRVRRIFQTLPEPSLLVGNCRVWDTQGNCQFINKPRRLQLKDLLLGPQINPFPVNPSAYFYHKSLHDRVGIYSLEEHYTLDVDFLLRAVQVAHLQYVDQLWGNFRNIEGTKTLEDNRNGLNAKRIVRLMRHYRQFLPWHQRYAVALTYAFYQIWERVQYFTQRPYEILPKLRLRLIQLRVNP
jgi:glycosyltransferase involved in cell wall biosynthesis